jgi:hypothetical protein
MLIPVGREKRYGGFRSGGSLVSWSVIFLLYLVSYHDIAIEEGVLGPFVLEWGKFQVAWDEVDWDTPCATVGPGAQLLSGVWSVNPVVVVHQVIAIGQGSVPPIITA